MAHDDHSDHRVNYLLVFFALCIFTGLSVIFDAFPMGSHGVTIVLVLAVAVAKALCVMMFFMHLKFESNWKYVLLAPTTILAIGLPLALFPDIGVAYYTSTAPQQDWQQEYEGIDLHHAEGDHHEGGDAEHHDDGESDAVDHVDGEEDGSHPEPEGEDGDAE